MEKIKYMEPNPDLEDTDSRHIIDADPTSTIVTATIQLEELADPKEGEHLFHSHMWVKGTPLHFIVDNDSQKNLISSKVIKQLAIQHQVASPRIRSSH